MTKQDRVLAKEKLKMVGLEALWTTITAPRFSHLKMMYTLNTLRRIYLNPTPKDLRRNFPVDA